MIGAGASPLLIGPPCSPGRICGVLNRRWVQMPIKIQACLGKFVEYKIRGPTRQPRLQRGFNCSRLLGPRGLAELRALGSTRALCHPSVFHIHVILLRQPSVLTLFLQRSCHSCCSKCLSWATLTLLHSSVLYVPSFFLYINSLKKPGYLTVSQILIVCTGYFVSQQNNRTCICS